MFHRDQIFNSPQQAWEKYKTSPEDFSFPERVTIEVTNRCNLQCLMCPRNNLKMKLGDMEMNLFKKIIDELALHLPVCLVPFFRGESLLHPHFLDMLTYAKEKGLKPIQFATNACFLSKEAAMRLLDLEIDFVSFSIDVNAPEVYEKIRKHSNYAKVFENVLNFIEEKNKQKKILPELQVSAVKTTENAGFIEEFVEFWRHKVERVRIYEAHSMDGNLGHLATNQKEVRRPCLKQLTDMVIYWNGDVAVCNHDWDRTSLIGNVNNDSIETIWNNENYRTERQRQIDGNFPEQSVCRNCDHWQAAYAKDNIIGSLYADK